MQCTRRPTLPAGAAQLAARALPRLTVTWFPLIGSPLALRRAGFIYILGREAFAIGYASGGPNKRMLGATLIDLALVALFGATMYGGWLLAKPAFGPSLLVF